MQEIADLYTCSIACISKKIKKCKLKEATSNKYIGKKFGKLLTLEPAGYDKHSHLIFKCLCDCGNIVCVKGYCLLDGNTKSCGCSARRKGKDHPNFAGHEEISSSLWHSLCHGATSRNLEFQITIEEIWQLFLKQNRKCALSGIKLQFAQTRKTYNQTTASLDRIDSTKGYAINNVQWVHKKINQIKMNMDQSEFIDWCQKITTYQIRKVDP